jgi:aspartate kinase
MDIVVQKFGGTSLKSKESRKHVVYHITHALREQNKVLVVVSALGKPPDAYATDSLLNLVNYPATYNTPREIDLLLSCGETISAVVVANELKESGIRAYALTGPQAGIITNNEHMNAKIKQVIPSKILTLFNNHDVVVVAGFQGKTEDGEITTIGRGGSDTTAAALALATHAKRAEIYTDVDGIMTADPKLVRKARVLSHCTYNETCSLAYQGAKVIHPHAVELAMQGKLLLHVRSTYKRKNGTLIMNKKETESPSDSYQRTITGIAHQTDLSQIKVTRRDNPNYSITEVFKTLAAAGISVDFINMSPNQMQFTLPNNLLNHAIQLFEMYDIKAEIVRNCAKVSAVGAAMNGIPGIAAKVVSALAKNGIEILQAADSHTTIWVLIQEDKLKEAVNALHDAFQMSNQIPNFP